MRASDDLVGDGPFLGMIAEVFSDGGLGVPLRSTAQETSSPMTCRRSWWLYSLDFTLLFLSFVSDYLILLLRTHSVVIHHLWH